jgi:hypothetical protein
MEEQKLRLYVKSWCPRNYLAAPLVKPLLSGGGGVGLSITVIDAFVLDFVGYQLWQRFVFLSLPLKQNHFHLVHLSTLMSLFHAEALACQVNLFKCNVLLQNT